MNAKTKDIDTYLKYRTISMIPEDVLDQINKKKLNNEGKKNILMEDSIGNYIITPKVFGSEIARKRILSITVLDSLKNIPQNHWDISQNKDKSIVAWVKNNNLYIAAEGKIYVKNCESLFSGYTNVRKIEFNGCFDTSQVTNMSFMFNNCSSLQEVDIRNFDTSQVTDMNAMFQCCESLQELDVSNFDTSQVTGMNFMFYGCSNLQELDVRNFDTSKITTMSHMFYGCKSLTWVDVSRFDMT